MEKFQANQPSIDVERLLAAIAYEKNPLAREMRDRLADLIQAVKGAIAQKDPNPGS